MNNAFMIAAVGSGCGKTTITCALLQALKDRGAKVRSFKCGPDYIDPMFHNQILNIPSKNLDLFFTDTETTRKLFLDGNDSDISVVEGVMGLYDGISPDSDKASSYDLSCALDLPIVLVVNAAGMGRSILAVIRGFLDMDRENRVRAVILNRISEPYYDRICPVIEKELGIAVIGYYPKVSDGIESRYLGLKLPEEIRTIREDIRKAGNVISHSVDISRLLKLTGYTGGSLPERIRPAAAGSVRIAIARDEAFCFYYEDNLRILRELGAELVEFSPLHSQSLPENIDGILLGGGYPELHAQRLEANEDMRRSVGDAVRSGIPVLAECGGFMYLHDRIDTGSGCYEMCRVIEGACRNTGKLVRFGYTTLREQEGRFTEDSNFQIKGHEFHYYDSTNCGSDALCEKPLSGRSWKAGHITENQWMGFAHLYYPSNPDFALRFLQKCARWKKETAPGQRNKNETR